MFTITVTCHSTEESSSDEARAMTWHFSEYFSLATLSFIPINLYSVCVGGGGGGACVCACVCACVLAWVRVYIFHIGSYVWTFVDVDIMC